VTVNREALWSVHDVCRHVHHEISFHRGTNTWRST